MIDEKELIEEIKRHKVITTFEDDNPIDCGFNAGLDRAIELVSSQPKVDEWIPVEERMPNYLQKVLVTYIGYFDGKRHCDDVAYREISGQWMWALDDTHVGVEIIAWMPLPEPYQGEEKTK